MKILKTEFTNILVNSNILEKYLEEVRQNAKDKKVQNLSLVDYVKDRQFPTLDKPIIVTIEGDVGSYAQALDLSGADLQGVNMKGATFINCTLENTIFRDTDLTDVKFQDCKLIGTDFRGADLQGTKVTYSDLQEGSSKIKELKSKFRGIKLSVASVDSSQINVDQDRQKADSYKLQQEKLEKEIVTLDDNIQSLNNPTIWQEFRRFVAAENPEDVDKEMQQRIEQNQKEINDKRSQIKKLDKEVETLKIKAATIFDPSIMDIFKQYQEEERALAQKYSAKRGMVKKAPLIIADPNYLRGIGSEEINNPKNIVKVDQAIFNDYLDACRGSAKQLALVDFIKTKLDPEEDKGKLIPDLSGVSLQGKEISNANMEYAIFAGVNLENAKFENCNLNRANLEGANLQSTKFNDVTAIESKFLFSDMRTTVINNSDFRKAYMTKVDLSSAQISNSNFENAILIQADGTSTVFEGGGFKRADLSGACLVKASMQDTKLPKANLTGACIIDASFTECNMKKAFLNDARGAAATFTDCNMRKVKGRDSDLSGARFLGSTELNKADLRNAMLREMEAKGIELRGALLDEANLGEAKLQGAKLDSATVRFADLSGANLEGASASHIDLRFAQADGVIARGANLTNAKAEGLSADKADFQDATLTGIDLQHSQLTSANLENTNLHGARLEGASLTGNGERANFDGAHVNPTTSIKDLAGNLNGSVVNNRGETMETDELRNLEREADKSRGFIQSRKDAAWNAGENIVEGAEKASSGARNVLTYYFPVLNSSKNVFMLAGIAVGAVAAGVAAPYVAPAIAAAGITAAASVGIVFTAGMVMGAVGGYIGNEKLSLAGKKTVDTIKRGTAHFRDNILGVTSKKAQQFRQEQDQLEEVNKVSKEKSKTSLKEKIIKAITKSKKEEEMLLLEGYEKAISSSPATKKQGPLTESLSNLKAGIAERIASSDSKSQEPVAPQEMTTGAPTKKGYQRLS